jgi:hypothetical protein
MVIPSPRATRIESDIAWYEVAVSEDAQTVHIAAFDDAGAPAGRITSRPADDDADQYPAEDDANDRRVVIEVTLKEVTDELPRVHARINGHEIDPMGRTDTVGAGLNLTFRQWTLLNQYVRLSDALRSLPRAANASAGTDSLSSTQCWLLFAAIEVEVWACGMTHDPISCEGLNIAIQQYHQHCHGGGGTAGHVTRHVVLEA